MEDKVEEHGKKEGKWVQTEKWKIKSKQVWWREGKNSKKWRVERKDKVSEKGKGKEKGSLRGITREEKEETWEKRRRGREETKGET